MHRLASRLRQAHLTSTSTCTLRSSISTRPTRLLIPRIPHRRIAFRHPHNTHHPTAPAYQAVRFQQPTIFSRKRQLTLALYILATYALFKAVSSIVTVEIKVEETPAKLKKDQQQNATEQEEDDEDEEYTFIPLTWATPLPREFYRGSDPEWAEFVKIAKDKPRHKKIQDALVSQIFAKSKQHPILAMQLGKDLRVGKYWLDISFPDGPPQEYERWGLEFSDSGDISWAAERISPEEQFRLKRALWPVAVGKATFMAGKAVSGIQWRRIKQWLGMEEVDPSSPEERLKMAIEMALKQQQNAKNQKGRRGSGGVDEPEVMVISRAAPSSSSATSSSSSGSDIKSRLPWPFRMDSSSSSSGLDAENGGVASRNMAFPIAQIVFQTTLMKSGWAPKFKDPPRGTFLVQGMMEIRGSKGQILFDVRGCYDPVKGKYVDVKAQNRGIKSWNQRPKGGP